MERRDVAINGLARKNEVSNRVYYKDYEYLDGEEKRNIDRLMYAMDHDVELHIMLDGRDTGYTITSISDVIRNPSGNVIKPWSIRPTNIKNDSSASNRYIVMRVFVPWRNKPIALLLHRAKAMAIIPNPYNKPQVNHINHIKSDNRLENLEWNTAVENMQNAVIHKALDIRGEKHPEHKFTEKQVREVCRMLEDPNNLPMDISKATGVSRHTIWSIMVGESWKDVSKDYNIVIPDHHRGRKYTEEQVRNVCELLESRDMSNEQIGLMCGVDKSAVADIATGRTHAKISSEYNIKPMQYRPGENSFNTEYSNDQIKSVCEILSNPYTKIKLVSMVTGVGENTVWGIYDRSSWTSVSKDYIFPKRIQTHRDTEKHKTVETQIIELIIEGIGDNKIANMLVENGSLPDLTDALQHIRVVKDRYLIG